MKSHIFVSGVTAVVTTVILLFVIQMTPVSQMVGSAVKMDEVAAKLKDDPTFIASIQSAELTSTPSTTGAKGDKGDKGDTGTNGNRGSDGTSGDDGSDGANGNDGTNGADGATGSDGRNGADGSRGDTGDTGATGLKGDKGDTGARGAQGLRGEKGDTGATGATGAQGIQGIQGIQGNQGAKGDTGDTGIVSTTATALSYDSVNRTLGLNASYSIPTVTSISNWNTAYGWGDHAAAGYAVLLGQSGGQTLIGGTAANNVLTLQSNSASSGNTSTNAAIRFNVGNNGSTTAATITQAGNVGIGTATPGSKLTLAGDVAVTTNGTDTIKPFQFFQITGLGDNPSITTFGGQSYSTNDWSPAVVGIQTGGTCGTNWTNGTLVGFKYWWENNSGNWRLSVDMSAPNDGCNTVQVMFVRKEFAARTGY